MISDDPNGIWGICSPKLRWMKRLRWLEEYMSNPTIVWAFRKHFISGHYSIFRFWAQTWQLNSITAQLIWISWLHFTFSYFECSREPIAGDQHMKSKNSSRLHHVCDDQAFSEASRRSHFESINNQQHKQWVPLQQLLSSSGTYHQINQEFLMNRIKWIDRRKKYIKNFDVSTSHPLQTSTKA